MSRVLGVEEMKAKIRAIAAAYPQRIEAALYLKGQILMTESKRRCPVSPTAEQLKMMGRSLPKGHAPGTLRASGQVEEPVWEGKNVSVTLSYGGAASDYAVVQHERLDFHHTTGQAKYLQSVIDEARPDLLSWLAEKLHIDKGTT